MPATLFELKDNLQTIGAQMNKIDDELVDKANNPKTTAKELTDLQNTKETLQKRFDIVKKQFDEQDTKQKALLRAKGQNNQNNDPKQRKINAFASVIKDVMNKSAKYDQDRFKDALTVGTTAPGGDNNGNGEAFLPINISSDLISEPFKENPLRNDATYSQVTNLVIPRISVEFGDAFNALADGDAAKEAEVKGEQVKFGRFESKVRIGLSDAIMIGTNTALVQYVNDALLNGASQAELIRAFATAPATGEEHMSFYDASNAIASITADDTYLGVKKALADLDDAYADNAKVYMSRADYYDMIEKLANGSTTLYGAQPEEVLGAPVVFTSRAAKPVVGDFSLYHANYDPQSSIMEQYKDYQKGINYFQVTLYYDAQVKLASAFRIVNVAPKA